LSPPTLVELRRVIDYPFVTGRYHWTRREKDVFLRVLSRKAALTPIVPIVTVCKDEEDNMWFACAEAARAKYIVSRDKKILAVRDYKGVLTVKPGCFVEHVLRKLKKQAA
jgi:putative PIN family toxin of toxin-antitoxin system